MNHQAWVKFTSLTLEAPHQPAGARKSSRGWGRPGARGPHLHAQADGVEHDEGEHQVLEVGGGDHVPHLVLVRVLGDVALQWAGLQGILHALALGRHSGVSGVGVGGGNGELLFCEYRV